MHSGWCWGNGDFYTSTEKITFEELEKNRKDIFEALDYNGYIPTVGVPDSPEEADFARVVRKFRNEEYIPTEDLLILAYGLGILYWTEWETEELPETDSSLPDINKETNPEGYYRDRLALLSQLPEETTEKDFRSSEYDQIIDDGLVPIDNVTDRLDLIESIKKRDANLSQGLSDLMDMIE